MIRLERRQLIVIGAAVLVFLAAIQWLVRPVFKRRQKMAMSIELREQRLQELLNLEKTYRQALADNARVVKDLSERQTGFTLFAFMESLASRDGLKNQIEYMRPSVKTLSEVHQQEQVEMRLNGVTMASLVPYLYHIETATEQVRINRLTIKPQQKNPSLLEVNMVVVTHASREESQAAAAHLKQGEKLSGLEQFLANRTISNNANRRISNKEYRISK